MHEIPCSEPVCWFKEFCTKSAAVLTPPRFYIGQEVNVLCLGEESDRTLTDQGVIIGFASSLPDALVDGWWYVIEYSHFGVSHWLSPGYVDWAHESELRPRP